EERLRHRAQHKIRQPDPAVHDERLVRAQNRGRFIRTLHHEAPNDIADRQVRYVELRLMPHDAGVNAPDGADENSDRHKDPYKAEPSPAILRDEVEPTRVSPELGKAGAFAAVGKKGCVHRGSLSWIRGPVPGRDPTSGHPTLLPRRSTAPACRKFPAPPCAPPAPTRAS